MMPHLTRFAIGLPLLLPLLAAAQIDLSTLDRDMLGPKAQVLVLGTMHLREQPTSFQPRVLAGLIDKLAAFKPDIIAIENVPGEECDMVARHPEKYDYGPSYCVSTALAKTATGLGIPEALAAIDKTLAAWPAPSAAQRRRLAALFLAADDRASAYAQWLQLPAEARREGDGLDAQLIEFLQGLGTVKEESLLLAAPVAARLGLARLRPVDNHTGDNVNAPDAKAFGDELAAAWKAGAAELDKRQLITSALSSADDWLPLYRFINSPAHMRVLAELNVRAPLRAKSATGYPQMWVAGWEIRNMRMVANIRETFRERPASRVLVIVGASHKPWFDAWLGQLQGVEIVDAEKVLASPPR